MYIYSYHLKDKKVLNTLGLRVQQKKTLGL